MDFDGLGKLLVIAGAGVLLLGVILIIAGRSGLLSGLLQSGTLRFEAMLEALGQAPRGDAVLLHGYCHNPTGANPDAAQWVALAELMAERGLLPFIDIAYQGFGEGLEADAAGLRLVAGKVPEMVVAARCSKNFAVYRDRVGAAMVMAAGAAQADAALSHMLAAARTMYSMPPDHGAAAVRLVLADPELRADWEAELEDMRRRMLRLRVAFAEQCDGLVERGRRKVVEGLHACAGSGWDRSKGRAADGTGKTMDMDCIAGSLRPGI